MPKSKYFYQFYLLQYFFRKFYLFIIVGFEFEKKTKNFFTRIGINEILIFSYYGKFDIRKFSIWEILIKKNVKFKIKIVSEKL